MSTLLSVASCTFWDMGDWSDRAGLSSVPEGGGDDPQASVPDAGPDTFDPTIPVLARDSFTRTVAPGGLGTAEIGGDWSVSGGSDLSVDGLNAVALMPAGESSAGYLHDVSTDDADVQMLLRVDRLASGTGLYISIAGRQVEPGLEYRGRVVMRESGVVTASIERAELSADGGSRDVILQSSGVLFTSPANVNIKARVQVTGTAPTHLRIKIWIPSGAEPKDWALDLTDTTGTLQTKGGVGFRVYVSSSATNGPVRCLFDDFLVRPASRLPP